MFDDIRKLSAHRSEREGGAKAKHIAEFWNSLRNDDELDTAIWEVLEPIEKQVADCLGHSPPRFAEADSLTAQTMILLAGRRKP